MSVKILMYKFVEIRKMATLSLGNDCKNKELGLGIEIMKMMASMEVHL